MEQSPPRHQALCYSLFLKEQTQDISLLRIFQLSNIVHHPYQSVQCVCGCVCWGGGGHCVYASFAYIWTLVYIVMIVHYVLALIYFLFIADNISISMYIMCVILCLFSTEPQGRRFTHFHCYYYIIYDYETRIQREMLTCLRSVLQADLTVRPSAAWVTPQVLLQLPVAGRRRHGCRQWMGRW